MILEKAARLVLIAAGMVLVVVTVLPLLRSDAWWIRIWDFPRTQIVVLLLAAIIGSLALFGFHRPTIIGFVTVMVAALGYQAWRIYPYTPLHSVEALDADQCEPKSRIRLLVANVLVDNRNAQPLLALVRDVDPDLVLLMETDTWWDGQLAPLAKDYAHVIRHPQDDSYGMHLFSRFALVEPQVRFLLQDYVPSIHTGVTLPSGEIIDFYGVHPTPPPQDDTGRRDAELLMIGKLTREAPRPAIVAGDLNDVAWSRTTRLFQKISGLLDPRIGRGLYPTYNANWPLLKWPLDHVFYEDRFTLLSMERMPDIQSDHFPFFISLCLRPGAASRQEAPSPEPGDSEAANEAVQEGRKKARTGED